MKSFAYVRPKTVPDALAVLGDAHHHGLLAGGTCLVDLMKQGVMAPQTVVDLNFIPSLRGISVEADGFMKIAAATTLSHVARDDRVKAGWPMLHEAIVDGLTPQLRNAASVAGNVMQRPRCVYFREAGFACNKKAPGSGCAARNGIHYQHAIMGGDAARDCIATHPSDLCVALTAFGAELYLASLGGERRVPIAQLHRLPGDDPTSETTLQADEMITAVCVPPQGAQGGAYVKGTEGFALASCAALLAIVDGRIALASVVLGGVAHAPWRSTPAEAVLLGAKPTSAIFTQAADAAAAVAVTDVQTAFRVPLLKATIMAALARAASARSARSDQ